MEELINDILGDLIIELEITANSKDETLLRLKVKNALLEVKERIKFPKSYQETTINKEIKNYRNVIRNVAVYDFCQIGSEWQQSHSESNVNMKYRNREELFTIIPYANCN